MRFEVKFDTGEEEADAEYVAIDWQGLIADLEAEGTLRQVAWIRPLREYAPPARDMDDVPF